MLSLKNKKAFTLIELMIVVVIMWVLMITVSMSWKSIENSVKVYKNSANDIHYSLNWAFTDSVLWNWSVAVDKWEWDTKTVLTEEYLVHFEKDNHNSSKSAFYNLLELQNRKNAWWTFYSRIINKEEIEVSGNNFYLKNIIWKTDENDSWTDLENFTVSFRNPYGKSKFYFNNNQFLTEWNTVINNDAINTINEFQKIANDTSFKIVDLEYFDSWDDSSEKIFTIRIYDDLQFYTILNK